MKERIRIIVEALRAMSVDRAFQAALVFSFLFHGALFLSWPGRPGPPPERKPAFIVARLIGPASSGPSRDWEEKRAEAEPSRKDGPPTGEDRSDPPPPRRDIPAVEGEVSGLKTGDPGSPAGRTVAARAGGTLGAVTGRSVGVKVATLLPARASRRASAVLLTGGRPPASAAVEDVEAVLSEIRRRIEAKKNYPRLARKNGWEGRVLVELELGGSGELEGVRLLRQSGFPLLDRATLRAVREAEPYPPLAGKVRIPVAYRLEE
jgi:TonB family protein